MDDAKVSTWIDFVADVVSRPARPHAAHGARTLREVMELLSTTFEAIVSWNWVNEDRYGCSMLHPPTDFPVPCWEEAWTPALFSHPLIHWFTTTSSSEAMTLERVPESVSPRGSADAVRDLLGSRDLSQQLSMPVHGEPGTHRALVLSKGGADFDDRQLTLARRIQPMLCLLDQLHLLTDDRGGPDDLGELGLTPRESLVLSLSCEGLTAGSVARRLGCSPRTVNKHLEHAYRKLGVTHRLAAVRIVESRRAYSADEPSAPDRANVVRGLAPSPDVVSFDAALAATA